MVIFFPFVSRVVIILWGVYSYFSVEFLNYRHFAFTTSITVSASSHFPTFVGILWNLLFPFGYSVAIAFINGNSIDIAKLGGHPSVAFLDKNLEDFLYENSQYSFLSVGPLGICTVWWWFYNVLTCWHAVRIVLPWFFEGLVDSVLILFCTRVLLRSLW